MRIINYHIYHIWFLSIFFSCWWRNSYSSNSLSSFSTYSYWGSGSYIFYGKGRTVGLGTFLLYYIAFWRGFTSSFFYFLSGLGTAGLSLLTIFTSEENSWVGHKLPAFFTVFSSSKAINHLQYLLQAHQAWPIPFLFFSCPKTCSNC